MANKPSNHEQSMVNDSCTNSINGIINTNVAGSVNSNSMSTSFPSNHHLLVKHPATIDAYSSSIGNAVSALTTIGLPPPPQPPTTSHSQHQLNSANSFELNGVTTSSLSEDSGLPPTTNSSISSGDSTRMGMCKFEFELAESDAEVSQFDSLENCSDGGMSAENFNTLKKGPLAPIDPPPEFQDSPQTTLLRSPALQNFSLKLAKDILSTAITIMATNTIYDEVPEPARKTHSLVDESERNHYPDPYCYETVSGNHGRNDDYNIFQSEYHLYNRPQDHYNHYDTYDDIYASDSMLNGHIDNIYDVPCDEYLTHASNDSLNYSDAGNKRRFNVKANAKHSINTNADKVQSTKNSNKTKHLRMERECEIHNFDLYYRNNCSTQSSSHDEIQSSSTVTPFSASESTSATEKATVLTNQFGIASTSASMSVGDDLPSKSSTLSSTSMTIKTSTLKTTSTTASSSSTSTSATTFQRHKTPSILYSPLHYHASSNLSNGNRPNSRNSLNSRLSSSHNSLTITTSNKADDSIFITQAMSHDALTGREISDFYNVPIDSDIYALPIDVIRPISSGSRSNNTNRTAPYGNRANTHNKTVHINATATASMPNSNANQSTTNDSSQLATESSSSASLMFKNSTKNFRGRLKYVRNNKKRKRQLMQHAVDSGSSIGGAGGTGTASAVIPTIKSCKSNSNNAGLGDKRHSVPDNVIEPMHMTLDEVKRFYTSLYSSSSESPSPLPTTESDAIAKNNNPNSNKNSSSSNGRLSKIALSTTSCVFGTAASNKNLNSSTSNSMVIFKSDRNFNLPHVNNNNNINVNNNNISSSNNNNNLIINNNSAKCKSSTSLTIPPTPAPAAAACATPSSIGNATTSNHNTASGGTCSSSNSNNNLKLSKSSTKPPPPSLGTSNFNIKKISSSSSIAKDNINNNSDCSIGGNLGATTQNNSTSSATSAQTSSKKSQFSINLNLKQKFCSIFRFRKSYQHSAQQRHITEYETNIDIASTADRRAKLSTRALPPLPPSLKDLAGNAPMPVDELNTTATDDNGDERDAKKFEDQNPMDFAANIEKVKEYGWYWGPISSEAAEKILSNEPDGSFIVRDSSDDHYIFSLTFKLNNGVRHVRIEQDQGTFSFGSCAKFKSRTIMEFIENAVESSRSGRYLFFFHRRPEHGPMRVQLTNPVSRFKHIQSLQHMCRFVIRRAVVRKDLIQTLPLPRRLLDYLSYKNCYSEQVESDSSQSPTPEATANDNHDGETEEHVILR